MQSPSQTSRCIRPFNTYCVGVCLEHCGPGRPAPQVPMSRPSYSSQSWIDNQQGLNHRPLNSSRQPAASYNHAPRGMYPPTSSRPLAHVVASPLLIALSNDFSLEINGHLPSPVPGRLDELAHPHRASHISTSRANSVWDEPEPSHTPRPYPRKYAG